MNIHKYNLVKQKFFRGEGRKEKEGKRNEITTRIYAQLAHIR